MFYSYKPFPLEKWVSRLYISLGIMSPGDIDERRIAEKLNIYLTYSYIRSYAYEDGEIKIININKNLHKTLKREIFFHELAHICKNSGNQCDMTKEFRDYQERNAYHFTKYAAIPYHMLNFIDWQSETLIYDLAEMFTVSEKLALERVKHIYRNLQRRKSHESRCLRPGFNSRASEGGLFYSCATRKPEGLL